MLWYCRSTLIGRRVVVMWWRCLPEETPCGGGRGGGRRGARVAEGEGVRYTLVCTGVYCAPPPLLIVIGSTFSAGRYKTV